MSQQLEPPPYTPIYVKNYEPPLMSTLDTLDYKC